MIWGALGFIYGLLLLFAACAFIAGGRSDDYR